mmetsp:Transcript_44414/g.105906  ORF Transcript_44414/g.105906 Transcript_44414/m.105906 type:complete len:246 (+) Transcript_44414:3229-3966(+)
MTGRFWRRSQTTDVPLTPVDARICSTLEFQATEVMSDTGCVGAPGVYTLGVWGLVRSQMRISDSVAPDARRLGLNWLKSRPRTGPLCFCTRATSASPSDAPVRIPADQKPIEPSIIPPATIPIELAPDPCPPHASRWKRSEHLTLPLVGISLGDPDEKSTCRISRSAVVSNESSIALATVPTASSPRLSFSGDHATVADRLAVLRSIVRGDQRLRSGCLLLVSFSGGGVPLAVTARTTHAAADSS